MNDELKKLREQIDSIDDDILQLIAKRIEVVKKVGVLKRQVGTKPLDTKRRDAILQEKIAKAKSLGIDTTFIKQLFLAIHDEGVKTQKKLP